jgi:hypothetical protein
MTSPASAERTIDSGFSVSVHSVTIAHVLETSFDDTITKSEATKRNQREAASRQVVWNAQTLVESVTDADDAMKIPQPLGVKDEQGHFVEMDTVIERQDLAQLRKKVGIEVNPAEKAIVAKGLMEQPFVDSNLSDNENLRRAVSNCPHRHTLNCPPTDSSRSRREQIAATSKPAPTGEESATQEDPVTNRHHSYKSPIPEFSETPAEYAQRLALEETSFSVRGGGGAVASGSDSADVPMSEGGQRWTAEQKGKGVARADDQFASPPQPVETSQLLECEPCLC